MKISIDCDGTLWDHMSFFRNLIKAMQAQGHQVGILTGHTHTTKEKDIALMIARGFPRPDFYFGREPHDMPFNGAVMKSKRILQEDIDVHFDDLDYENPETVRLFKQGLQDQFHRVIIMQYREPKNMHFE